MSDRIHYQDRNPDAWSIRSALELLSADDVENISERDILLKYQDTLHQLNQKEQELHGIRELLHNIHAGTNENYLATKKGLQESASRIVAQVDTLDRNLRDLQEDPNLKPVIAREKEKERQRQEQRYKEALERQRKKDEQTQRELMERYENSRQEARQRIEQNQEQIKQEKFPVAPHEEKKTVTYKGILPSIPFSILGLLEFYIIYGLTVLGIALVFLLLSYIPIINTLVDLLFRIREDSPDMAAMFVSAILAYLGTTATAEHITEGTRGHALTLTGIYLVVLNTIFLIVNLVNSTAILPNIIIGISGIVMFYKNKDE